jgi:hypothetical protein
LGSDNSHNSQLTNSSSSAQVLLTTNGELIRCTSYDPISIGGSSRRSSDASCSSIAGGTRRTSSTSSQAKHLTQTDNLVIQPQSIALATERYSSSVSSIGSSISNSRRNKVVPPPNLNETTSVNHPNESVTLEECDSDQPIETMNNLILPDDMVCISYIELYFVSSLESVD